MFRQAATYIYSWWEVLLRGTKNPMAGMLCHPRGMPAGCSHLHGSDKSWVQRVAICLPSEHCQSGGLDTCSVPLEWASQPSWHCRGGRLQACPAERLTSRHHELPAPNATKEAFTGYSEPLARVSRHGSSDCAKWRLKALNVGV